MAKKGTTNRRQVFESMEDFIAKVAKKIVLDVTANLKQPAPLGTPVDTGWARANWIPSIRRPAAGVPTPTAWQAKHDAVPGAVSRQESAEAEIVTQFTLSKKRMFITNNVPYIGRLNRRPGHSQQAPEGEFVQASINKAIHQDLGNLGGLGR